jgi:predicted dehydrogenase/threonine dehydrogenase-like Zn-dependent dehydrogenase
VRQVIQYQKTGDLLVEDLPAPQLKPGGLLVRNAYSLISSGTERSSVVTAQSSWWGKARKRPELVKQILDNVKREGFWATYRKVENRLDNYKQLGYSSAGIVVESSVGEFRPGDRVACAGAGYAAHAEIIWVPKNLAVKVPEGVDLDEAAFATVGAIALQGVRQAEVHLGDRVVVIGLGLVGLLAARLLAISGCHVFGVDISDRNFELAESLGCRACALDDLDTARRVSSFTGRNGADAVLITAATTSARPVEAAVSFARKKGTIVVVGAVGVRVPWAEAYEKELNFRMSCSYGPGRYDSSYEQQGQDYPFAYVRWTEQRNMQAILELIAHGQLNVRPLITSSLEIERALEAYEMLTQRASGECLGIMLSYPQTAKVTRDMAICSSACTFTAPGEVILGCIGAGNHTQSYLLPYIRKTRARFRSVVTASPVNSKAAAKKFSFELCSTDESCVLDDPDVNLVIIGTRHDSHARYVIDALSRGKNVFVEKPLALTPDELATITEVYRSLIQRNRSPLLMVGYNRRFSPSIRALKEFFGTRTEPLLINYRVSAGRLRPESWYLEPSQGGRIIGEVCHFIDTAQFLAGSLPRRLSAVTTEKSADPRNVQNLSISIEFEDQSVASILYAADGSTRTEKEYLEVFGGSKTGKIFDFKTMILAHDRKQKRVPFIAGKGHSEEMTFLLRSLMTGEIPISFDSLIATSRATFAVIESLRTGLPVDVV